LKHETNVVTERESSLEVSWNEITERNLTKDNFNIQKADIKYIEGGTIVNLVASLKHRTDRNYLITLRLKSGIEIARLYITKDTILVNDRINKKLYYGSIAYLGRKYGITADAIPVLFGDMVVENNEERKFGCNEGKGEIKGSIYSNNITYKIDCNKKKVSDISFDSYPGVNKMNIKLSNFRYLEGKVYPENIELVETENKSEIKINILKIEFSCEDEIKFIPGTNYEKVHLK
jgi:hypothetical protein